MNLQLINWASVYGGDGAPVVAMIREDESLTPSQKNALEMELALLKLKAWRPKLWFCIVECYIRNREDISAAEAQRISVSTYRQRLSASYDALYLWLKGRAPD